MPFVQKRHRLGPFERGAFAISIERSFSPSRNHVNALLRPAAVTQLQALGKQINLPVYDEGTSETPQTTFENIQPRSRGLILMALSNASGFMVLSTGNKSELAVGYCTLYGDMAGGLALISDVPKTWVYRVAREANRRQRAIPASVFSKPPSAELKPGQTDQDDLPPYDVLDGILERYIEWRMAPLRIVEEGFDKKVVVDVLRRLDANEYKRGQAAPGLRITSKAFGYGWRVPISSRYRVKL